MTDPRYARDVLVDVLVHHQRRDAQHCLCGWGELGASHAAHVADVYEQSVAARDPLDEPGCTCGVVAGSGTEMRLVGCRFHGRGGVGR